MTIEVFRPAIKYNFKKKNSSLRIMYLLPVLMIFLGLVPYLLRPEEWHFADSWMILVGIAFLFFPLWVNYMVLSNLKKNPVFGTTVEWEIDEKGINGKGKGFTLSEDWELFFETHLTKLGILIYPQKQFFYWLPRAGFANENEYGQAINYLKAKSKNVTYSKDNNIGP